MRYGSVVTFRIPDDVARILKQRAKDDDRSLSQYLRRLIIEIAKKEIGQP